MAKITQKTKKARLKPVYVFGILGVIIGGVIVAGTYMFVNQVPKPQDPTLRALAAGLPTQKLWETSGQTCRTPGVDCHSMKTVLLALKSPAKSDFMTFVNSLTKQGWELDGKPFTQSQVAALYSSTATQLADAKANKAASDAGVLSFALLSPNLFGEQGYLTNGGKILLVNVSAADKDHSDADQKYILQSAVPSEKDFNFNEVIDYINASAQNYVLAVAVSE